MNIDRNFLGLSLVMLFMTVHITGFSQDNEEKHRTYIGLEFEKKGDEISLRASLTARIEGERGRKKISDVEISFYYKSDTSDILLGTADTNEDGIAVYRLEYSSEIPVNADGAYLFSAAFSGNNEFTDVSRDIEIKPIVLELDFVEIDSVKNIAVKAYSIGIAGDKTSIEEDVLLYVPRQFSMLRIGKVELLNGEGMINFPVTLPGDSIGNLQIIARIEESNDFGTVEVASVKNWGKPRPPVIIEKRRGLGDTDAPLWMVYTLIVLMSAVWFHYCYLLFILYSIKRKGKTVA